MSDSNLTHHRKAWPPKLGVAAVLGAVGLLAVLNRPASRAEEPRARVEGWAVDPRATESLEGFFEESSDARSAASGENFMKGVGLGLYSKDLAYDYGMLIGEVADHNAGWISLIYNMYQKNGRSTEIAPMTRIEEQEAVLRRAIRQAHERGLKVLSFPLVLLRNPADDEWRGNLEPKDLNEWFDNYATHILRLAALAEAEGVEAFCVGSEFSTLERHEERWRHLIDQVRAVYSGSIIYSANWDHYRRAPFWDAVDAIGLSGYYELTRTREPTMEALTAAWTEVRDIILDWREYSELTAPIVFTEVGYPNQDGTNMWPWDYTRKAKPDPEEQAMCYEAFIRAWHGAPGFGGAFFYNWFGYDTLDDTGYSPRGKPAAQIMKRWYGSIGQ